MFVRKNRVRRARTDGICRTDWKSWVHLLYNGIGWSQSPEPQGKLFNFNNGVGWGCGEIQVAELPRDARPGNRSVAVAIEPAKRAGKRAGDCATHAMRPPQHGCWRGYLR